MTETIVITYTDGTEETYLECSLYENDGKIVHFTGKKANTSDSKKWEINWSLVKKLSRK